MADYVFRLDQVKEAFSWLDEERAGKNPQQMNHSFLSREKLSDSFYANHFITDREGKITVASKHLEGDKYINWIMRNGHLPVVNEMLKNKEAIEETTKHYFLKLDNERTAIAEANRRNKVAFTKRFEDCMFHLFRNGGAAVSLEIKAGDYEYIQFTLKPEDIKGFVEMIRIIIEKNDHNYSLQGESNKQQATEQLLAEAFEDVEEVSEAFPDPVKARIKKALKQDKLDFYI
jgi:hypothetical protein